MARDYIKSWQDKTYRRYTVLLRKQEDRELIEWVEEHKDEYKLTEIFRAGVKALMQK